MSIAILDGMESSKETIDGGRNFNMDFAGLNLTTFDQKSKVMLRLVKFSMPELRADRTIEYDFLATNNLGLYNMMLI